MSCSLLVAVIIKNYIVLEIGVEEVIKLVCRHPCFDFYGRMLIYNRRNGGAYDVLLAYFGRIYLSCSVGEIVGLVNQKSIISLLTKESLDINLRVKKIVYIKYYYIAKLGI